MGEGLQNAGVVAVWVVAALRVTAARDPRQRPLWLGLCLIAVTTTLYLEPVVELAGGLLGDLNVVDLVRHIVHVASAAVMLWVVLAATGRHRHTRPLALAALTIALVITWLNLAAAPHTRATVLTPELPPLYWALQLAFYLLVDVISVVVCWHYGWRAEPAMLRWSLAAFGASRLLGCILWLMFGAAVVLGSPAPLGSVPAITGAELLLQATSVAVPGVAALGANLGARLALWRLWPLWDSLTRAVAHVRLPGDTSRHNAWTTPLSQVRWQTHRAVIEIRDAALVLGAHHSPTAASAADAYIRSGRLTEPDAAAAAAACCLETALRARLAGGPAGHVAHSLIPTAPATLEEELDFLVRTARFHSVGLATRFASSAGPT
ncbi:MAG: DUF6545 domain-containing protein [Pseudonocardia sp.]